MTQRHAIAPVSEIDRFDEIIDVRSPGEFAEDHIPGARNYPVLDDAERARVGTLYKQVSPFAARRLGAALVARNIAAHIETHFLERPKHWRPLIVCWRGGQRSGAMTLIFRQIGWGACQLEGGYKAWRGTVIERLAGLPGRFDFRVICGATGSGKSRILGALADAGAQILDLEGLAAHKGSVLGVLPGTEQPSQKLFESRLLERLVALDPARPVYVEAESRKIGRLQVPEALIGAIRNGTCLSIEAPIGARVDFLLGDYAYFVADPGWLVARLAALKDLRGRETVERWQAMARDGAWAALVHELLAQHYDPLYARSQERNYAGFRTPHPIPVRRLDPAGIAAAARDILAREAVSGSPDAP